MDAGKLSENVAHHPFGRGRRRPKINRYLVETLLTEEGHSLRSAVKRVGWREEEGSHKKWTGTNRYENE